MTIGVQAGEEELIDLCGSDDDDAPAQQPAGVQEHRQRSQAAVHPSGVRHVKQQPAARRVPQRGAGKPAASSTCQQQPAPRSRPEHPAEAAQTPEAKRPKAVAQLKPAQCAEMRQLGIIHSQPPKLSGNNALLKELAHRSNRVRRIIYSAHLSTCLRMEVHANAALQPHMCQQHILHCWLEYQALRTTLTTLLCNKTTPVLAAGNAGKAAER